MKENNKISYTWKNMLVLFENSKSISANDIYNIYKNNYENIEDLQNVDEKYIGLISMLIENA